MRRLRRAVVGISATALALTMAGAPAVAEPPAEGRVAIVQGVPNRAVDVCLNGTEVRSGLRYGGKFSTKLVKGFYDLKVFLKDPRRCKGTRLARRLIEMSPSDLTIVLTRKSPKVVVFDNLGLGTMPAANHISAVVWRHAADLGNITFKIRQTTPEMPVTFAADPTPADPAWQKRDEMGYFPMLPGFTYRTRVTRPGKSRTVAGPSTRTMKPDRRHEWILVGTSERNARLVTLTRSIQPIP